MTNDITERDDAPVPAWMKAKSTGAQLGNLDASDIKPPEVKLLQRPPRRLPNSLGPRLDASG